MADRVHRVDILRVGLSLPCPIPVLPGTPDTMRDGEPIPIEERTEACAVDAWWFLGLQLLCDVHLREACELLGMDFAGVVEQAGGLHETEKKPWAERRRYEQELAKKAPPWQPISEAELDEARQALDDA
jgi:hypothetical protein